MNTHTSNNQNQADEADLHALLGVLVSAPAAERAHLLAMLEADGELAALPGTVQAEFQQLLTDAKSNDPTIASLVGDSQTLRSAVGSVLQRDLACANSAPRSLHEKIAQLALDARAEDRAINADTAVGKPASLQSVAHDPSERDPSEVILGRIGRWVPIAMAAGLLVITAITVRSFLPGASTQPGNTAVAGFALRLASDFATQDAVPTKIKVPCGDVNLLEQYSQQHIGHDPALNGLVSDASVRVIGRDTCRIPPGKDGSPCVKIQLSVLDAETKTTNASLFVTCSMAFLPAADRDNAEPSSVYSIPVCESTDHRAITGWRADGLSYFVVASDAHTGARIRARLGVDVEPVELPGCVATSQR